MTDLKPQSHDHHGHIPFGHLKAHLERLPVTELVEAFTLVVRQMAQRQVLGKRSVADLAATIEGQVRGL